MRPHPPLFVCLLLCASALAGEKEKPASGALKPGRIAGNVLEQTEAGQLRGTVVKELPVKVTLPPDLVDPLVGILTPYDGVSFVLYRGAEGRWLRNKLILDANVDRDLTNDPVLTFETATDVALARLALYGRTYRFAVRVFEEREVRLFPLAWHEGMVDVDGTPARAAVLQLNYDRVYYRRYALFLDIDGDGEFDIGPEADPREMMMLHKWLAVGERFYRTARAKDLSRLTLERAELPAGRIDLALEGLKVPEKAVAYLCLGAKGAPIEDAFVVETPLPRLPAVVPAGERNLYEGALLLGETILARFVSKQALLLEPGKTLTLTLPKPTLNVVALAAKGFGNARILRVSQETKTAADLVFVRFAARDENGKLHARTAPRVEVFSPDRPKKPVLSGNMEYG